jgi:glutamate:Na+ symporter, ESS family
MPPIIDSIILLLIILLVARFIKRRTAFLQKLFIPSSLIAGVIGLALGPQLLGYLDPSVTSFWEKFPKYLINVVFAGLFLGRFIPSIKEIWKTSAPMIAFGNTLAWGQYVIGIALSLFLLTPLFNTNPIVGSLIEISFEGGHGTAAGLAPTFEEMGWAEGTDIALGLATFSLIAAIVSGVILINIFNRRNKHLVNEAAWKEQEKQMIRSGYDFLNLAKTFNEHPKVLVINIAAFVLSIGIGWVLLQGLIMGEDIIMSMFTDIRFFTYLPLFTLAMLGGLIVQLLLKAFDKQTLIKRRTAENFSKIALDLLIASAVATVSLEVIGENWAVFSILAFAGVAWILGCFYFFAPKFFPSNWFINGITNVGQSMGMTATGLLMNRLVDPRNEAKAKETFAYKQLAFEPFMGGGIVTAMAAIVIYEFGSGIAFIITYLITAFWIILGLWLGKYHKQST